MLYTPYDNYFNTAKPNMRSTRRNIATWSFLLHKNHVKNDLKAPQTGKRMLTAALFKTWSIASWNGQISNGVLIVIRLLSCTVHYGSH